MIKICKVYILSGMCLIITWLLMSCGNNVVYYEFQPVPHKAWDKENGFSFHFEIKDTSVSYDMSLQLRNSGLYPYQNIWILYEEQHPSSAEASLKDTVEYRLVDERGRWTGNGVTLFQNQFPIRKNYHFPDTGTYTITIRHGMTDNPLKGIEDIGLLIEGK